MLGQVVTAALSHYWFKNHEPTLPFACGSLLVLPLAAPSFQALTSQSPGATYAQSSLALEYLVFYLALSTSIIGYRLSPFHPLAKYPGPILCKVSQWTSVWVAIWGTNHVWRKRLHDTYGPVVRIGPNELSIADKDLISPILGTQGLPRGPIWDGRRFKLTDEGFLGYDSVIDCRDADIHHQLRKDWNTAFSPNAVRDYHEFLEVKAKQLRGYLQDAAVAVKDGVSKGPIDLGKWVTHFAFDFMGDIAFGGCFDLMGEGDVTGIRANMEEGMVLPFIMQFIPWIRPLLVSIPFVSAKMKHLADWGVQEAYKRMAMETKRKDLYHHLYDVTLEKTKRTESEQMHRVVSDSMLTILAGSDTTATTLSAIFCYILSDRRVYNRLRAEIDEAFLEINAEDGFPDVRIDDLPKLPYLNAVINEGLRLVPANPTSIQRAPTPGSGGRTLVNTDMFIPDTVSVSVCLFAIMRDKNYFSPQPDAFIPERWLEETTPQGEKYVTNKEAFIPWSYGPANCAGRALAIQELRYIVATVVRCFDVYHAGCKDEKEGSLVLKKRAEDWTNGLKDRFIFDKPGVLVDLIPRK